MPWHYPEPVALPLSRMFRNNGVLATGQANIRKLLAAQPRRCSQRILLRRRTFGSLEAI
jgi:hypothetical protein